MILYLCILILTINFYLHYIYDNATQQLEKIKYIQKLLINSISKEDVLREKNDQLLFFCLKTNIIGNELASLCIF